MSRLSEFARRQWREWGYRHRFKRGHQLRRNLAYYVVKHGFEIGDFSYGAPIIRLWGEPARLKVGRYCSIGPEVEFVLGGNHHLDHISTFPFSRMPGAAMGNDGPFTRGDIVLGSDVWIGSRAMILSGVSIGSGAVIGAHAVISRDVPPYAVVVGNPARVVRKRFSDDQIDTLLALRWWDLPEREVRALRPLLQSNDINALLEYCRRNGHYAGGAAYGREAQPAMPARAAAHAGLTGAGLGPGDRPD